MTIGFDLSHDLDLEFSRSNTEFAISQPKMVRLPRNEKQTYRLNSRAQMWPSGLTLAMTLTLNFQGQMQNLLYLSQKWYDCHETKSKHIDWTLGLKGVGGAVRFLVVGTIGQGERPPRGQLWMEQCLTSLKYWPIEYTIWADPNYTWGLAILADSLLFSVNNILDPHVNWSRVFFSNDLSN